MAIIFNIAEALALSPFNILQEPIKMLLTNEEEAFEKESLISKIFVMHNLDSYREVFKTRTSMGNYEPGYDMEPAKLSDFKEGYDKEFTSVTWRNSFVISKQTMEDNQMMTISTDAMGFVKSYGRTREIFAFGMLSGTLKGTYVQGKFTFDCHGMDTVTGALDGVKQLYFTGTNSSDVNGHVPPATTGRGTGASVQQSNKFHCALDIAQAGAHQKLLNILGYVENAMMNFTDYDGNPTPCTPNTIVVPNYFGFRNALLAALKTQYTEVLGNNGINLQYGKWTILTSPYLNGKFGFTEKDQAFIMIDPMANRENLGAVFLERVALEISSYYEEQNEANIWKGRARYSAAFGDWRAMCYVHCGKPTTAETNVGDSFAALFKTGVTGGTYATDYNAFNISEAAVAATPAAIGGTVLVGNPTTAPVNTKAVEAGV